MNVEGSNPFARSMFSKVFSFRGFCRNGILNAMNPGLGLYRHALTRENFQFARQAGATHIVAHLVDYFRGSAPDSNGDQPRDSESGRGFAGDGGKLWSVEELLALRKAIETEGLKLEVIENFDPAHWHDALLDGPKKKEQFEGLKIMIRALRIVKRNGFQGVLIPDHTPKMSCAAPRHASMAFAPGYMRAALQLIEKE